MQEITTLISNVGFPIACVCGCFYFINNTMTKNTNALNELSTSIKLLTQKLENKDIKEN